MRQRGFTLAYGGWFNIVRIADGTEKNMELFDSLERTFYLMQDDFEQIVNREIVDELGGKRKSLMTVQG